MKGTGLCVFKSDIPLSVAQAIWARAPLLMLPPILMAHRDCLVGAHMMIIYIVYLTANVSTGGRH